MALTGDAARVAKLAQSLGASKSKAEGAVSTALKSSGGSSKTLSYKPGSLETMTVAQAKAAGKEAEYNQMVSGFFPGGAVKPLDAGGGKTFSEIASKIPVDAIGEQKPIYVPPVAESPFKPDYLTQPTTTTETKPTESATTPEFDFIKKELEGLQIPSAEKDFLKLEKELQIRQKEQAVSDANARLTAVTNQQQADIMAIRNQSSTEGGTAGILSAREDAINRSAVIKALPIQAEVALAQDNLKYATDRLDTLASLRREDNQNKYERSVKLLEMTYNDMTAKQKEKADLAKEMRQRQYEITDSNISRQDSWAKVFAESNQPGLMSRVTGLDPADPNFRNKLSTVIGGYKGDKNSFASALGLTIEQQSDPFIAKMLATSGGKPLTDTFAQQLNKGLTVLGQIGTLQTNIQDMNTGPIVGAFKGLNPWDTNAQTIKAQLNAIVPNLARGVYGEVGVLTDNDIKTYSQTLPNLKSTEDIRNAVLGITVDLISKSIKRNLEINAANGKDVSGFIDIYTEMQNTRDSIFEQIPGYKSDKTSVSNIGNEDLLTKINGTISSWGDVNNQDFFNQL